MMKRALVGLISGLFMLVFPMVSHAGTVSYTGIAPNATASIERHGEAYEGYDRDCRWNDRDGDDDDWGVRTHKIRFTNLSSTANASINFTNMSGVSGVSSTGKVVFKDRGLWVGFSGASVAANSSVFMGNLITTGVVRLHGDVAYDLDTATYTGSGRVVEFTGTVDISGMLPGGSTQTLARVLKASKPKGKTLSSTSLGTQSALIGAIGDLKLLFNSAPGTIITVTDGVPDRSYPIPAFVDISMTGFQIN